MINTLRYLLLPVLHVLGPVLMGYSSTMLLVLLLSLAKADGAHTAFVLGFAATFSSGLVIWLSTKKYKRELTARHGFLLVTLTWMLVPLFAVIPILTEMPHYTLVRAYFETMSCLTTTGATMMTGLDDLPVSINAWRCLLSWIGGMGLIVLSVAILPLLGVGGAQIIKAETSGPLKEQRLTPRIADTAKALYLIYIGISIACAISYHLAGMSWEDAVMHMMTTVSLSGIAAHDASFQFFNSPEIDAVAVAFMLICGCNFSLHFAAWHGRNIFKYFKDPECLSWIGLTTAMTIAASFILYRYDVYQSIPETIRYAAFTIVSVASTTGYSTADYSLWPLGIPFVMMFSAAFASCAGSTGGGLKMLRILILIKQVRSEFTKLLYPNSVNHVTLAGKPIDAKVSSAVLSYVLVWFVSVFIGMTILLFTGLPLIDAFSASIASITNLGPGLGSIGPAGNYSNFTEFQLAVSTFLMLVGRLEIFTVFVLFTKNFWKV